MNVAPAASRSLFDVATLYRHQVAAAAATTVDILMMVALVRFVHFAPAIATFASAIAGGVVNFTLGRSWAFRDARAGAVGGQAFRYALACLGGAALNASLLALVLRNFAAPYVPARVLVSIVVSLAYTYPIHARFVFRTSSRRSEHLS